MDVQSNVEHAVKQHPLKATGVRLGLGDSCCRCGKCLTKMWLALLLLFSLLRTGERHPPFLPLRSHLAHFTPGAREGVGELCSADPLAGKVGACTRLNYRRAAGTR